MAEAAWIKTVPKTEASGKVRELYDKAASHDQDARLAEAVSLWPELMETHERENELFFKDETSLDQKTKCLIAALVSQINHSEQCGRPYRAALSEAGWTDEKISHILQDIRSDHVDPATRAVLIFTEKLTSRPKSMEPEDIDQLRNAGLSDRAILEAAALAGYFNYISRLTNALVAP